MKLKLLLATSLLTTSFITQAEGWVLLPVLKGGYQADMALAVVAGNTDIDDKNLSTKGVELSLNCPLLKAPNHTIRQQVSYVQTDKDGVKTKSFELSPHHMFNIGRKFSAGFGPSVGYTKVETDAGDDSVVTYGIGASARYNVAKGIFVGAEARYAKSQDLEITGQNADFKNTRALIKLGYQF